jgi:hypothetical protein
MSAMPQPLMLGDEHRDSAAKSKTEVVRRADFIKQLSIFIRATLIDRSILDSTARAWRSCASQRSATSHVAYGSFPDLDAHEHEVRFTPMNGHRQRDAAFPRRAKSRLMRRSKKGSYSIASSMPASTIQSGSPALRSPSVSSFAFVCPPRAIHADIVKAGSSASRRAAASCASASRPRWAKADARQR